MKEFRHNPRTIAYSLFYLLISWFFSLSIPYLVFVSLGHPVSWSIILVTSAIFLAVKSIPVGIPFEVGLPEAVMTTLYISMGVPGALSRYSHHTYKNHNIVVILHHRLWSPAMARTKTSNIHGSKHRKN